MSVPLDGSGVDPAAWELVRSIPPAHRAGARWGLRLLCDAGSSTALQAPVDYDVFWRLEIRFRSGLRALWNEATKRGLREQPLPGYSPARSVQDSLPGVATNTMQWLRLRLADKTLTRAYQTHYWLWFRRCGALGLPTDLNVDLGNGPVAELLVELLNHASKGLIDELPRFNQLTHLRRGIGTLYKQAAAEGLRERLVPDFLLQRHCYTSEDRGALRKRLRPADAERIDRLFEELDELARLQQAGLGEQISARGKRGLRKTTVAQGTCATMETRLFSLLYHYARAHPGPVALSQALEPAEVVDWVCQGVIPGGRPMSRRETRDRWPALKMLLERALYMELPLLPRAGIDAIDAALAAYRRPRNIRASARDGDDQGDYKFFPTGDQIEAAIALVEEDHARAKMLYESGHMSRTAYWEALRDRTVFQVARIVMARKDTLSTFDLLQAQRAPGTKSAIRPDGSVVLGGARAKEVDGHYFVNVLFPPLAVDFIQELLEFEGRSIDQPLRDGEKPHRLQAERKVRRNGRYVVTRKGDHWGRDVLKNDDLPVAPLFREKPDQVRGVSYQAMHKILDDLLARIGWPEAVPHTFRVMGAIYWKLHGWDLDDIRELGLWKDLNTLMRCYARLNVDDRRSRIAAMAPSRKATPSAARQRRGAALHLLQQRALALSAAGTIDDGEWERFVDSVQESLANCGRQRSRRPAGELSREELVRLDEAVKPLYAGGLKQLLGRAVLESDRTEVRKRELRDDKRRSDKVTRLLRFDAREPRSALRYSA